MKRASVAQKSHKKKTTKKIDRKSTLKTEPFISTYQVSEGIVKLILDKIITNSIHQSNMNKINSQINDYCFNYIYKLYKIKKRSKYFILENSKTSRESMDRNIWA